jgi:HEAT repeat protein
LDRLTDWLKEPQKWLKTLLPNKGGGEKLNRSDRDTLLSYLERARPSARWLAAEALGDVDPGEVGIRALAATLADPDPILRSEAGAALARLSRPGARIALIQAAGDEDFAVQAAAADALGRLSPDEEVLAALARLLVSGDVVVRQSAAEALARSGPAPRRKQQEPVGSEFHPQLAGLLDNDDSPMVRRAAALALGRFGDQTARAILLARRDDSSEDWRVRQAAGLALARLPQFETLLATSPSAGNDRSAANQEAPGDLSEIS